MNRPALSDSIVGEILANSEIQYSEREKAIRIQFVNEYLDCYDPIVAAVRCGFGSAFAEQYAIEFMGEVFVQQLISKGGKALDVDGVVDDNAARSQIITSLIREANYFGAGSSHGARVSALGKLTDIYGLEAPKKVEQTNIHKGGVMVIPAAQMSMQDYEKMALEQQTSLVHDASAP